MEIRPEQPKDFQAIRQVNRDAFGRTQEADLVEALRQAADPFFSFVAIQSEPVVGHICLSSVAIYKSVPA